MKIPFEVPVEVGAVVWEFIHLLTAPRIDIN